MKPLGEIVRIIKGSKAPEVYEKPIHTAIRYIQIEDLRPDTNLKYAIDKNGTLCEETDVLIAWDGANAGTIGFGLKGYVGSTIAILRPILKNIFTPYLGFFLQSKFLDIQRNTTGATIPHISRNYLENLNIPIPSLNEQKRIAAILQKADRLRRLRRYARQLSDGYLHSVFLEMFGDPKLNPKNWDTSKFGDIGVLDRGRSKNRPRNAPFLYGGKIPFIQTGDIANAEDYISTYHQTYSDKGLQQSKLWPKGTLCITIAANIAKTAILTFNACFPDSVVGFSAGPKVQVEFVQHWLSFLQKELEEKAPESAQKNINLEILRGLTIPVPPIETQKQFALIVEKYERIRLFQRESERQAEHLFQSLLHQAFQEGF